MFYVRCYSIVPDGTNIVLHKVIYLNRRAQLYTLSHLTLRFSFISELPLLLAWCSLLSDENHYTKWRILEHIWTRAGVLPSP